MPARKTKTKNLDKLTMLIGFGMSIVSIPQLIAALKTSDIHSVSLITWGYFTFQAAVFSLFALKHRETPLVFTYVPLFIVQLLIVVTVVVRSL